MSGSTGWNNAVRSRLYFQTAKASDGTEPNKNLRTLEGKKSNYGEAGGKITLEWKNGLFVPIQREIGLDKMAAEAKADEVFLVLLKRVNAQGRNVSAAKGPTYAPAVFAAEPDNHDIKSRIFDAAMRRLLNAGRIRIETSGPPSRQRSALVLGEKFMSLPTNFQSTSSRRRTAFQLPVHTPPPYPPTVGTGPTGGLGPPASPDREENLQRKNPDGTPTASRRRRKENAKMMIWPLRQMFRHVPGCSDAEWLAAVADADRWAIRHGRPPSDHP